MGPRLFSSFEQHDEGARFPLRALVTRNGHLVQVLGDKGHPVTQLPKD